MAVFFLSQIMNCKYLELPVLIVAKRYLPDLLSSEIPQLFLSVLGLVSHTFRYLVAYMIGYHSEKSH
jgi:hypothetical protein